MLTLGNEECVKVTETLPAETGLAVVRDRVAALTDSSKVLQFCDFIITGLGDGALPTYESIDLMQVPHLAPHIFVHDYRGGIDQGMLVKFSGTAIDEHYGKVLQGRYVEEVYTGSDGPGLYFPLHYRAIAMERYKQSTTLYFPCSSDGMSTDYGVGMVIFEPVRTETKAVYMML